MGLPDLYSASKEESGSCNTIAIKFHYAVKEKSTDKNILEL